MISLTATIGQSVLRNAIRLQDNHVLYTEVRTLDEERTGCPRCVIRQNNPELCKNCLIKIYKTETKKEYVNERSRYGVKETLNKNAILLFIWLHFNNPDENGLVRMIDVNDAASDIGCTRRTIINNLSILNKSAYIAVSKTGIPGYYNILLLDYSSYFKKAYQNGRGYITLSRDVFFELVKQININALRISIRALLFDSESPANGIISNRAYRDIKYDLPSYVTIGMLKDIFHSKQFSKLFQVFGEKKYTVSLLLRESFGQNNIRNILVGECRKAVLATVDKINKDAKKSHEAVISLSDKELKDVANIGMKYPSVFVAKAIKQIYDTYFLNSLKVKNLGALVRTFAKQNMEAAYASA